MDNNSATLDPNAATAMRFNQGKTRYALVPYTWTTALAEVMTRGAVKYAPDNWKKGMDPKFMVDSLERHLHAFRTGEVFDPDSGNHHLAHVAWNALALMTYERDGMVPPEFYETPVPTSLTEPHLKEDTDYSQLKKYGDPDFTNKPGSILYWRVQNEADVAIKQVSPAARAIRSSNYPDAWWTECPKVERAIRRRYPNLVSKLPALTEAEYAASR